jgi:hypothetical protein
VFAGLVLFASVLGAAADPAPGDRAARSTWLGRGEAELREAFGAALLLVPIGPGRTSVPVMAKTEADPQQAEPAGASAAPGASKTSAASPPLAATKDPFAEQRRLVRHPSSGDVRRVEYELFRDRVYRVRWRLAERFERPLMDALVAHLTTKLGKPYYDQVIEGKFGSGRATLRRAGWRNESRIIELRQLNPLVGGPLYLSLSDQSGIAGIVASGGTAAPEPDSIGRWWTTPIEPQGALTARDRTTLVGAFDGVWAQANWER